MRIDGPQLCQLEPNICADHLPKDPRACPWLKSQQRHCRPPEVCGASSSKETDGAGLGTGKVTADETKRKRRCRKWPEAFGVASVLIQMSVVVF